MAYPNQHWWLTSLLLIVTWSTTQANENIIMLFLEKYPELTQQAVSIKKAQKYSEKLKQPNYIYKKIIKAHFQDGVAGLFGLYEGYATVSNHNGELFFPRMQQSATINLLLTKKITPVYMIAPATIHHWEISNPDQAKMYTCSFSEDQVSGAYIANMQRATLPKDNAIPLHTVILLSNPEHVYVPTGVTVQSYSPHLIIPQIYIKKGYQSTQNALYMLSIKQYFETSQQHEKKQTKANTAMILQS